MVRLRADGFTLIELMIVTAIIAVVLALALPGLLRAKMASNERAISGSLKSAGNAQATASNTMFGGTYWAADVAGLYYTEWTTDGAGWSFAQFLTDTGLCQADVARAPAPIPMNYPTYNWRYTPQPALTYRVKSGYVVRMHSSFQAGLIQGTAGAFGIVACPSRYDRGGVHCYILDEEMTVYKRAWNGATTINAAPADAALLEGGFMVAWPTPVEKGQNWASGGQ